ncbi:hypothetical protein M5689_020784 [Euphorbia peplus]|nr:hypothetical protein M5689_020784 [Euphorbia peplus]
MGRPLIIETGTIIDLPKQRLIVENGKHPIVINGDKRTTLEVHWNLKQNRAPAMVIGFPLEDHRGHDPRPAERVIDFLLTKSRSLKLVRILIMLQSDYFRMFSLYMKTSLRGHPAIYLGYPPK